jgi:hypothetical protein
MAVLRVSVGRHHATLYKYHDFFSADVDDALQTTDIAAIRTYDGTGDITTMVTSIHHDSFSSSR